MGRLAVDFSEESPESIGNLGRACVSVDSTLRPTAAEALYKLLVALAQEHNMMIKPALLPLLLLAQAISCTTGSSLFKLWVYYDGRSCEGTPYNMHTESDVSCTMYSCFEDGNMSATGVGVASIACTSDYKTSMSKYFGNSPFIVVETFYDYNCETLKYAEAYFASSNCEGSPNLNSSEVAHVIARLESDGSAVLDYYYNSLCDASELYATYSADKDTLATHKCDAWTKWYYFDGDNALNSAGPSGNEDTTANRSSGTSTPKIVAIIVGVFLLLVLIALVICCCKRRSNVKQTETQEQPTASLQSGNAASLDFAMRGQVGLWDDDVITAKRIPRDKVRVKKLLSRGAFGEVYEGVYNGNQIAVKMLLPHTRGNLKQVNDFLAEAKMTATMDHAHIVAFVGVAWDSLSDVCVVLEFMDGGDLRALLSKLRPSEDHYCPAHLSCIDIPALTYASCHPSRSQVSEHSTEPCDGSKLTDFGISRERLDQTMTAGVGTSLWMAPEVMLGERYDVKADLFSFGVVLSELDLHTLPYAQAKDQVRDANGRKLPDAAILQQVAMGIGKWNSHVLALLLGRACVSLNPNNRPTAAEALYRLQVILAKEMA
ncbi:Protein kinase-like domain [Phytophthora cactorum]|nr:Protein kinase-like domain [Phytophthora cactorum]